MASALSGGLAFCFTIRLVALCDVDFFFFFFFLLKRSDFDGEKNIDERKPNSCLSLSQTEKKKNERKANGKSLWHKYQTKHPDRVI